MAIDLAVVPVAGYGTRLLPATKSQPKEMLPVGRRPVVQYVAEELSMAGVTRLLFVTGAGKNSIENHFDINAELIGYLRESGREAQLAELSFERRAVEYFYMRQRRQLGLGHAVLCSQPFVDDRPFVVALGDSIIGLHGTSGIVGRMVAEFESRRADAVVAFESVAPDDVVHYGIAAPAEPQPQDVFALRDLVEKPAVHEAPSHLAVAARYVFSAGIFEELRQTAPGKGGEIQLTDAIRRMIAGGGRVFGLRLSPGETRYDIGNFESYFRAFAEFALADPEYGPGLREHLTRLLSLPQGGPAAADPTTGQG
ncbi:MAG: UTP--glucose-1-phosphate uridylyltransferase [Planctomycetales bacterium]